MAVEEPEATVTDAGTVKAELLSDRATAVPPEGALADKVTVQVLAPPEAIVVGLHDRAETVVEGGAV